MGFTSISTYSYRNLHDQRVSLNARRIFLVGENGQGKSNFLEAVYLLSYGSSFRTKRENELITHGSREMALHGRYIRPEEDDIEGSIALKLGSAASASLASPGPSSPPNVSSEYHSAYDSASPSQETNSSSSSSFRSTSASSSSGSNTEKGADEAPAKNSIKGSREKIIELDGKRVQDRKQLISHIPAIVFSHDDIYFVNGPPERRRWFFNQTMSLFDPMFIDTLRDYRKILKMRNLALKDQRGDLIPIYDQQLAVAGLEIQRRRAAVIEEFNQVVAPIFEEVSTISEPLSIEYRPSWPKAASTTAATTGAKESEENKTNENNEDSSDAGGKITAKNKTSNSDKSNYQSNSGQSQYSADKNPAGQNATASPPAHYDQVLDYLAHKREQDLLYGTTSSGPHRDRFVFRLAGTDFARIASTGQLRLMSLILRIGQCRYFSQKTGRRPILLLDDVLLELDSERRTRFLTQLPDYEQAFFTFLPDEKYLDLAERAEIAERPERPKVEKADHTGEHASNEKAEKIEAKRTETTETAVYWVENGWIQKMETTNNKGRTTKRSMDPTNNKN